MQERDKINTIIQNSFKLMGSSYTPSKFNHVYRAEIKNRMLLCKSYPSQVRILDHYKNKELGLEFSLTKSFSSGSLTFKFKYKYQQGQFCHFQYQNLWIFQKRVLDVLEAMAKIDPMLSNKYEWLEQLTTPWCHK